MCKLSEMMKNNIDFKYIHLNLLLSVGVLYCLIFLILVFLFIFIFFDAGLVILVYNRTQ